jgi:hypothetical protein
MNETTKKYLAWLIVAIAILVAGYLGVQYPIPAPPSVAPPSVVSQALATGGIKCHTPNAAGDCVEVWNGGDLSIYSDRGATEVWSLDGKTGQLVVSPVADADAANYDNLLLIEHDLVGLGTKDRVYGIDIEMTRPAGYNTTNGDHDDAGIKIRMNNKATGNATGTVLRGIDVNVKNDNPSGAITTLSGATFTAQTDTGSPPAGNVSTAYAVQGQITANAPVTDSLIVADFRNFRQTATEPALEYGVQIRNGNTVGTGIDAGLLFKSEAATVGAFGYVIDMNGVGVTAADIRLSNGKVIAATDGGVVYNTLHNVTAAEINTGHTIVTVPATRQFRLVNVAATAYGATCTTSTSVYLKGGANVLATYTVANLVQSTLLDLTTTGVAVAADGASFSAQTAGDDVTIISDAATTAGCTGVRFVLSYALD